MLTPPSIEIQNQVLGQAVRIIGTPFSLHYRSDRVPGRLAAYTLKIPLTAKALPPGLKSVVLDVSVCGRSFTQKFPPTSEEVHTFAWDGKDAQGRFVPGKQLARIRIGYLYPASYPRPEITRWRESAAPIGAWDARGVGLGGWTLNVHHFYDRVGQVLYLGNGRRRSRMGANPEVGGAGGGHTGPEERVLLPAEDGSQIYTFDHTGRHVRTLHALTGGLLYSFEYDAEGRLAAIQDGDGNVTRIERGLQADPTAIGGPYGQRTNLGIAADGYLATITNPAGELVQLGYANGGLLASFTDPAGKVYRFAYDDDGRLTRYEDPAGGCSALEHAQRENGFEVVLVTSLQRESDYLVERLPGGGERRVNKCCGGGRTEVLVDSDGSQAITYPDATRLTLREQRDPRWRMQAPLLRNLSWTTPGGLAATVSVERAVIAAKATNTLSVQSLTEIFVINGRKYTSMFDAAKRQITKLTPAGRQFITTVDDHGRVAKAQIPGLLPMSFTYDERGRLMSITQGSGVEARDLAMSYNGEGLIASITDSLKRMVRLEYDRAGRVSAETLSDGRQILFSYDAKGNLTSITPPGRAAHTFQYTPLNLGQTYMPPDGDAGRKDTSYTYNEDKQLTTIMRPDGKTIELAYNELGRLDTITMGQEQVRLDFEAKTDRLKTITGAGGSVLAFAYDGPLHTQTDWTGTINGAVRRTFDSNLRIISRSVNGARPFTFEYDEDDLLTRAGDLVLERDAKSGRLIGSTLGHLTTKEQYNAFGERTEFIATFNKQDIVAFHYERDAVGHITKMIAAIEGRTTTYVYDYDLAGRLTDVARDGVKIAHYDYDSNGNRVAYQGQNRTLRARYDAQDRLIQYGDAVYRHTANGEWAAKTINGKTTNYEYDAFGNLRAATVADATKIEYLIDGMNRRTGKKVNGTLVQGILYEDRLRPIAELDGQNDVVSRFIYATRVNVPDYMEKGGKTYRIITDHLGSPRLVIDVVTGEPIQMMDYDEFGNVLRDTNPGFQPFGFAGGIYDVHTGLIHFGARDYDGETGRWTTRDPILFAGGSTQLYEYCFGDPINYRDPSGLWTYGVGVGASGGGPGASFGIQGSYTVDSQGNGAFVLAVGAGPGVGVGGSVGVTITGSNAPSVTDLSGPFTEIGGVTGPVSVSGFRGDSEHGPVTGGTFTLGPGVGAAGWGQETFTWVGRPFKPPTCFWGENPPPGGQLSDPSGRDWHGPVPVPAPTPTP